MPECSYCGESFDSEGAELDHLRAEHADELGPIDRRRVGLEDGDEGGLPTGPIALGVVLVAAVAVVGYVVFAGGGGETSGGPTNIGSVHYHGTINMTVTGERVDFGRPTYQRPQANPAFHFEGGDGTQWHAHAQGVTLAYAMGTLGINVTDSTVEFEGRTYRDGSAGTTVIVAVNGNDVDPSRYVLQRGDHVRIVVRREG